MSAGRSGAPEFGRRETGVDIGELGFEPLGALFVLAQRRLELIAPRREIGERAGEIGEGFLRNGDRCFGGGDPLIDAGEPGVALLRSGLERGFFGIEPAERGLGIGRERPLALEVGGKLRDAPIEFADTFLGAGFLALERLARDQKALQGRRGSGFDVAQAWQGGCGLGLTGRDQNLLAGAFGNDPHRLVLGVLGRADFGRGVDPAQVEQQRFAAPDLRRNIAIAHRLPRLGLQRRHLRGKLADDVLGAGEVLFRGLEAQFGFVAAGMKAGNAGGFFEHAAALIGARLDDLADAALVHQRRRARAGRGVGEQHGDIAGARLAAVDPKGRAVLAHDAARHFQRLELVEGGRRRAVGIVDGDCDFGMVTRRTAGIAREDDVVHLRRAHRLVGGFAHDPAHGFDQIGFAAAVWADDAGQSGFDLKIGRFDERLKADQAQPRELHSLGLSKVGASRSLGAAARRTVTGESQNARAESFSVLAWGGRCRIGAENESSLPRAQQRRRIIQTFVAGAAGGTLHRAPAGRPARTKNPYPSLR